MSNVIKFKQTSVGKQQGELARFKVVQGPDYGSVYVIGGTDVTLGRGEDNDVVILDLKASRFHAQLSLTPTGWYMRDKGSANGIIHNGHVTREARLKTNDT